MKRINKSIYGCSALVHSDTVYLSGVVSDTDTDIKTQTREVLARIDELLAEAGTDKTKVISCLVILADMDDFAAMNEVYYGEWIDQNAGPTRACIEGRLAAPKYKVEIIATAAV